MNSKELVSIIDEEISNSVGYYSGKLAEDRQRAMEYYYGEPFGNEVDGRSQFISQDVADTIEWIMPALMKIFMAQDDVVIFEPQGPEDEEGAKQATDYANYVFTKVNPGFVILYSFFKDGLLLKNGFVKIYWEDYKTKKVEDYSNLDEIALTKVFQDLQSQGSEVEIESMSEGSIRLSITSQYGKICIDPVPPDEVLVSKNARWDIQQARCVTHRCLKTASELKSMGITNDLETLSSQDDSEYGLERQTRYLHEQEDVQDEENRDPASKLFEVDESYILADFDGDGIAERRMVMKIGNTILENEEGKINLEVGRVPLETCTPIMMPHKLYGRSIAELIMDLQFLKSETIRQIIDNLRFTNNPRKAVLDGMVNIDDLLTVRAGGIVRMKTFDAVKDLTVPFMGAPAFNFLGYIDQVREQRTGTRYFQGVDPNALSTQTSGVAMANFVNASMERINLIARIFAETGVKGIFQAIFELASKHVTKEQVVRLRNKFVPIDPRAWAGKYDVVATVGIGTGSKEQVLQGAAMLGEMQQKIAEGGMFGRVVTEQNVYNLAKHVADAVAPKKAELFFSDPKGLQPPKPPEDPPEVKMQREKAQMADKTKRDTKAVDFLTQIATLASQPQPQQEDPNEERSFQMGMKRMEMDNQRQLQREGQIPDREKAEAYKMDAEGTKQVMQIVEQMAQMQQQQAQMLEQMLKVMSSPKKLITDDKGEPIGVELA